MAPLDQGLAIPFIRLHSLVGAFLTASGVVQAAFSAPVASALHRTAAVCGQDHQCQTHEVG